MAETPTAARSLLGKKGAVFMGDKFIELDDPAAVTLEDLCESFGTPWESGMHVRQRSTGRVVATLPFEPLPPLSEVADVVVRADDALNAAAMAADAGLAQEEEVGGSSSAKSENVTEEKTTLTSSGGVAENSNDAEEEEEDEGSYAVIYDLVNSNAPEVDEVTATLAGPLGANLRGIPGIEETMRQLVELGAAELLTAEPLSAVHAKREYSPAEAPGLLRRIVYPAAQYSPYRAERDPVSDGKHALFRSTAASVSAASPTSAVVAGPHRMTAMAYAGEGGPYTSYLDSYALGEQMEVPQMPPPTSVRKSSLIVPLTNDEQQRIFGAQ